MKKWMWMLILVGALGYAAEEPARNLAKRQNGPQSARRVLNKKVDVQRMIPHLAVNDAWKSALTIRNDLDVAIAVLMEFNDRFGNPIGATFYDSDDFEYNGEGFQFTLFPYEIYVLEFDQLEGNALSFQVAVVTAEEDAFYGLEALYSNFSGQSKVTAVGVGVGPPGDLFVLNLDQRLDAYTLNQKFRGLAITNNEADVCDCEVRLSNDLGESFDQSGDYPTVILSMNGYGKWLGTIYDLYPDIDQLLPRGFGYLEVGCTRLVSTLGLAFEAGTPIVASVPIDYFGAAKKKRDAINSHRR